MNYLTPPLFYFTIYMGLLALLGLTYTLAFVPMGAINLPISLAIAVAKAILILLYFMHLRSPNWLNRIFACVGVVWLLILITLSLSDYLTRNWTALPGHWPQ